MICVEEPTYIDHTVHRPRVVQKPRYTRPEWKIVQMPKTHTNYKPGKLINLGADQCRYTINDDKHIMCGKKTVPDRSWCEEHYRVVIKRGDANG
jgi:hypothetical protein